MEATESNREIEIKLRIPDADAGRRLLSDAGFTVRRSRYFESNILYDTPDQALRGEGKLLRIRDAGGEAILTYKGPDEPARHKVREELETTLGDGPRLGAILEQLGFEPAFRYEKYRTEFVHARETGLALLDETPIGVFLELEGPGEWIDRTARALGFEDEDYILASYGRLFIETLDSQASSSVPDMVFHTRSRQ